MRPCKSTPITLSILFAVCCTNAFAQNSFFGANPSSGGSKSTQEDDGAIGPGIPPMNTPVTPAPAGGDYTSDEKRVQKKYKGNLAHAKHLIIEGEAMMKAAPNKESKEYKKGKIMKEVGEKSVSDLKTNNPFDAEKEKPIYAEPKKKVQ
jgi:hypothetical protein